MGFTKSTRGPMYVDNLVNGRICGDCNSGWMNEELEKKVKELVQGLINCDPTSIQGLDKHQKTLALWCLKTAATLNHASNYRKLIPADHFRSLYQLDLPQGIHINLGFTAKSGALRWRQSQSFFFIGDVDKTRLSDVYKISFQFKRLLIKVSYVPFTNFIQQDHSIFLWPTFGRSEELRVFENIDDFDLSGVFVEISAETE